MPDATVQPLGRHIANYGCTYASADMWTSSSKTAAWFTSDRHTKYHINQRQDYACVVEALKLIRLYRLTANCVPISYTRPVIRRLRLSLSSRCKAIARRPRLQHFYSKIIELWPIILTFQHDPDNVKVPACLNCQICRWKVHAVGQKLLSTHKHTNTRPNALSG